MNMILATLAATIVSALPILLLCIGDPKRRRTAGKGSGGMSVIRRRVLATLACVPGIACALSGDAAAFLMWLGGCALVGWGAAVGLSSRGHASRECAETN